MYDNVEFARELKEVRNKRGITIDQMAKHLDTSNSQIIRIEAGHNVTINTLARYLEQLDLDLNDIFTE